MTTEIAIEDTETLADEFKPEPIPDWKRRYKRLTSLVERQLKRACPKLAFDIQPVKSRPDRTDEEWYKPAVHFAFEVSFGYESHSGFYSAGKLAAMHGIKESMTLSEVVKALQRKGLFMNYGPTRILDIKRVLNSQTLSFTLFEESLFKAILPLYKPSMVDIVASLFNDATDESHEEWCANLGVDPDSRKWFGVWQDCREIDRILSRSFKPHVRQRLANLIREF